jgi:protein ImuA
MTPPSKDTVLESLRARIRALERARPQGADGRPQVLPLGPAIDRALPGGLPLAAVHEVAGGGAGSAGAALGFTVAVLARLGSALQGPAPVLWCLQNPELYGPGLAAFGLEPDRLIVVRARRRSDVLWAMEEGLRCRALAAVVGEVEEIRVKECRRLQLAAEAGGVTGFLLREKPKAGPLPSLMTSWHVAPAPGAKGRALARWRVDLVRCRGGRPASWLVSWNDETGDFTVAAAPCDGPAREREAQAGAG